MAYSPFWSIITVLFKVCVRHVFVYNENNRTWTQQTHRTLAAKASEITTGGKAKIRSKIWLNIEPKQWYLLAMIQGLFKKSQVHIPCCLKPQSYIFYHHKHNKSVYFTLLKIINHSINTGGKGNVNTQMQTKTQNFLVKYWARFHSKLPLNVFVIVFGMFHTCIAYNRFNAHVLWWYSWYLGTP